MIESWLWPPCRETNPAYAFAGSVGNQVLRINKLTSYARASPQGSGHIRFMIALE